MKTDLEIEGDTAAVFERLTAAMEAQLASDAPDLSPILDSLLSLAPDQIQKSEDAVRFLHLLGYLSRGPVPEPQAWQWATAVAARHPRHGGVLSLLGSVGDLLRNKPDSALAGVISFEDLDALFRRAMKSTPDQPGAFARTGLFYLNNQRESSAEPCLATAFELDPRNPFVAIQLSDLLTRTDRATAGLAVLERCLGEGEPDAEVLWKAGLAATSLARYESALWHFTRLGGVDPDRRWVHYYRAIALLGLKQFAEAMTAIDLEAAVIRMPTALHVHTVRAAVAAGLNDLDAVRRHIDAAVFPPLGLVNYLSMAGIVGCFTRLWAAAVQLPESDRSRMQLQDRMLTSGLTPLEFWDHARANRPKVKGLLHFWVDLHQPLDQQWPRAAATPDRQHWKAYTVRYGVLAADEADAERQALDWQSKSAPLPPQVRQISLDGGIFTDSPGVTQRGYPQGT